MSFLTSFTPPTFFAIVTAESALAWELTKPLSCTVPLNVSTLISADLRLGCSKIAVFTFAVITESSTYSPVPSDLGLEAQPSAVTATRAARKVETVWIFFKVVLRLKVEHGRNPRQRLCGCVHAQRGSRPPRGKHWRPRARAASTRRCGRHGRAR